jgi:uncharacterized protein YneF (UPF0154 family)
METVKSIIATHQRTWIGSLAGLGAGYYVATKSIKTTNKWYIGASMIAGMVAGSFLQDKIMTKKVVITEKKVAGVEK